MYMYGDTGPGVYTCRNNLLVLLVVGGGGISTYRMYTCRQIAILNRFHIDSTVHVYTL